MVDDWIRAQISSQSFDGCDMNCIVTYIDDHGQYDSERKEERVAILYLFQGLFVSRGVRLHMIIQATGP